MSAPRIVAGRHRGRRLEVPPGELVRPSAERLREALFGILENQTPPLAGARFLDLFAGSGAVGLEALSRGADWAVLVESERRAAASLRRNIEKLGEAERARLLVADATKLPRATTAFDLVFLDPPYGEGLAAPALAGLQERGWLADDGLVVVELAAKERFEPPAGFVLVDERRYGAGRLVFLRAQDQVNAQGFL